MRNPLLSLLACAGIGLAPALAPVAVAHHSQSEFDFRQAVNIEGKVAKVDWRSPHARLMVDVINARGETEQWDFELPSPTTLMRRGWTRNSLKVGDKVAVNGAKARNFPLIGYARSIKDAAGKPLFTGVTGIYEPESLIPRPAAPAAVPAAPKPDAAVTKAP